MDGLILSICINDNQEVLTIKNELLKDGYAIGGIRQPTVPKAILRIIARLERESSVFRDLCQKVSKLQYKDSKF